MAVVFGGSHLEKVDLLARVDHRLDISEAPVGPEAVAAPHIAYKTFGQYLVEHRIVRKNLSSN